MWKFGISGVIPNFHKALRRSRTGRPGTRKLRPARDQLVAPVLAECEPVTQIAADHRTAGLDEIDVAVMDLAEQVVDDATSVSEADLQRLRDLGLSQEEITDVVLAAAARCFFSKTLDALGVRPDPSYRQLEPDLRQALVVGRPIADG